MTKKETVFSKKEIAQQLNNAVAFQRQSLSGLSVARQTRLRAYSEALIAPTLEHVAEQLLTPDEAGFIFSAAALLIFLKYSKIKNIPAKDMAKELVDVE